MRWLLAQTELADELAVAREVFFLQVVEQASSVADHPQKTAPRVVIFRVGLEVLGQIVDPVGEQRDLRFGAPSVRISFGLAVLLEEVFFDFGSEVHMSRFVLAPDGPEPCLPSGVGLL